MKGETDYWSGAGEVWQGWNGDNNFNGVSTVMDCGVITNPDLLLQKLHKIISKVFLKSVIK